MTRQLEGAMAVMSATANDEAPEPGLLSSDQTATISASLPQPRHLRAWIERYAVLSDHTRLTMLLALHSGGQMCVSDLSSVSGVSRGTISNALRLLRAQGIVTGVRYGRHVHYHIADPIMHRLLDEVLTSTTATFSI